MDYIDYYKVLMENDGPQCPPQKCNTSPQQVTRKVAKNKAAFLYLIITLLLMSSVPQVVIPYIESKVKEYKQGHLQDYEIIKGFLKKVGPPPATVPAMLVEQWPDCGETGPPVHHPDEDEDLWLPPLDNDVPWHEYYRGHHFDQYRKYINAKMDHLKEERRRYRCTFDDQKMDGKLSPFYGLNWINFAEISGDHGGEWEQPMRDYQNFVKTIRRSNFRETDIVPHDYCQQRLFEGEFGMELRSHVPWAHYKSQHMCLHLETHGMIGSKYMYYFSDDHTVHAQGKRNPRNAFGWGNPLRSSPRTPWPLDIPDIRHAHFLPPPYKEFFGRPNVAALKQLQDKPLIVISNKYKNSEWDDPPKNFMSVPLLIEMLEYLYPKYTILYKRFTEKELQDNTSMVDLEEKDLIRKNYPYVVLYEDLQADLRDPDDQNLLLFGLMANTHHSLSVQGGTAVVSSYFGGTNTILIKKVGGGEHTGNKDLGLIEGYGFFHRFSNAKVDWAMTDELFLQKMKKTL